jgi:hypothetical protein
LRRKKSKPVINQVMSSQEEQYGIRRDLIMDRIEISALCRSQADTG